MHSSQKKLPKIWVENEDLYWKQKLDNFSIHARKFLKFGSIMVQKYEKTKRIEIIWIWICILIKKWVLLFSTGKKLPQKYKKKSKHLDYVAKIQAN